MRFVPVVVLWVLFSGMPGEAATSSPLARFQQLGPLLAASTKGDAALAGDSSLVSSILSRDQVSGTRKAVVTLKLDALAEMARTGAAAYELDHFAATERDPIVVRFFRAVADALVDEWWESKSLARLAGVIWADPLLVDSRDVRALTVLDGAARRSADMAVQHSRYAAWLRWRFEARFRYVPARLPGKRR